jgi:iron complex transport system substrate-binding protein
MRMGAGSMRRGGGGVQSAQPVDGAGRSGEGPLVRAVSLLPAATEIVAALGCVDRLVGVSHECDWPPEVSDRPRVTRCEIHGGRLASADADRWVADALATQGTLYRLDEALVARLAPDVILTQRLCDVCAVSYPTVVAFAATLPGPPRVVSLEPATLADVLGDVRRVADALGVPERAPPLVAALEARMAAVAARVAGAPPTRTVLLEWVDPPYRTGHWGPEVVAAAGGVELLGQPGERAARVPWDAVVAAAPDAIVVACCGYDVTRALADVPILRARPGWAGLPAVQRGAVWVVDGSAYFSRPGPRLVDTIELLAALLHPDRVAGEVSADVARRVGA